jgi:hypothetical protein
MKQKTTKRGRTTGRVEIYDVIPATLAHNLGPTWNGWQTPTFTKGNAMRIVKAWNKAFPNGVSVVGDDGKSLVHRDCAYYHPKTKRFCFWDPGADAWDEFPKQTMGGVDVWPIGANCWTWSLAEQKAS